MLKELRQQLRHGRFQNVPADRSRTMKAIRARGNRTTELRLRMGLVKAGIDGWRLHPRDVEGEPDFFFPKHRLMVFADGCFWHGCPKCGHLPRTNKRFWAAKFARRRRRDRQVARSLRRQGFSVARFWEHAICEHLDRCVARIARLLAEAER